MKLELMKPVIKNKSEFQDVNKPYRSITILVYIGLYFVNLVMKSERGWAERRGGAYGRLCMSAK